MPIDSGVFSLIYPLLFSVIISGIVGSVFWSQGFFRLPPFAPKRAVCLWHTLSAFVIYALFAFAIPVGLFTAWPASMQGVYTLSTTFLTLIALSAVALFYLVRAFADPVQKEVFGITSGSWKDLAHDFGFGAMTYLLAYPLTNLISQIIYIWFMLSKGAYTPQTQVAIAHIKSTAEYPLIYLLTFICFAFIVPAIEELLFRGLLQKWLSNRLGSRPFALLLTALLFALVHYSKSQGETNFELVPSIFVLGLFLGFVREKRSLFTSMGLHMTFNTLSLLYITFS